ncbi:MAG: hypothetical protein BGN96_01415 [Bacteroidales bacterium 45-6]|uniref:hypothetical protein n=1 Tax=uncultured Dysgonomonas sp. TaxID=206096 RepID=UPI000960805D|nr:hypothetical protein [uncultured Dysgonomonas sp.]OJU36370.1 MAG: hypothetical protein BGN96_01415 [Bacteroidales bacterium 45-6]
MKYIFADNLNTAVFTTRFILDFHSPILYVYHFKEDGAWQFSGIEDCDEKDFRIISLEEAVNIDNSILTIANLPLGYYACRESKNSEWIIQKLEDQ